MRKETDFQRDFSVGKVWTNIAAQAVPLTVAQLVQLLYNIVDRIYIGHLPGVGSLALTGIGITFPITTLILAFANLFGTGGAPLFSIERGAKDEEKARNIMGNVFTMILIASVILMTFCYMLRVPMLYLFGASDDTILYAEGYLRIYLFGVLFSMIVTGMNGFISALGFPRTAMWTTIIGAVLNLILDPVFIFGLSWGGKGRGGGYRHQSGRFRRLGHALFDCGKNDNHPQNALFEAERFHCPPCPGLGGERLYAAGDKLPCANRMQRDAASLRRRLVCWNHDHY